MKFYPLRYLLIILFYVEGLYLLSYLIPDDKPLEGRTVIHTILCYSHGHPAIYTNVAEAWEFHDDRNQLFNKCLLNIYSVLGTDEQDG